MALVCSSLTTDKMRVLVRIRYTNKNGKFSWNLSTSFTPSHLSFLLSTFCCKREPEGPKIVDGSDKKE